MYLSRHIIGISLIFLLTVSHHAQDQTVGLFVNDSTSFDGYTLFSPMRNTVSYLIDNNGLEVNSWQSDYVVANSAYLLENGHLLRTADPGSDHFVVGGDGGLVEEYDWDGTLLWSYLYSTDQHRHHHDIAPLPNGNVLILAWELRTEAEAIAAGRDPAALPDNELWPEQIIEVQPVGADSGIIVWEWHLWDHLIQDFDSTKANYGVVSEHPELVDINYFSTGIADWIHANAIDYNAELDQILISTPFLGELWIIDHSTTTEEAAGHTGGNSGMGGDILYRWGNPEVYGAGTAADRRYFNQHDIHWIKEGLPGAGNLQIFNNGNGRPGGNYTTIEELQTTVDINGHYPQPAPGVPHGPSDPLFIYQADDPFDFYHAFISGSQRLPNGNLLICEGPRGNYIELTPDNDTAWVYINPVVDAGPLTQGDTIPPVGPNLANMTFRVTRYAPDYPGFIGRDLTPGDPVEIYPPDIRVTPLSLDFVTGVDESYSLTVTVRNLGTEDLIWTMVDQDTIGGADCPWLSAGPSSGTVGSMEDSTVTITVDATGLGVGTYQCNLITDSNDADSPQLVRPVTLTVVSDVITIAIDYTQDGGVITAPDTTTTYGTDMAVSSQTGITRTVEILSRMTTPTGDVRPLLEPARQLNNVPGFGVVNRNPLMVLNPDAGWFDTGTYTINSWLIDPLGGDTLHAYSSTFEVIPATAASLAEAAKSTLSLEALPEAFALQPNYPNPFNPTTTINYALPEDSDVSIMVYNLLGQQVAQLVNARQVAGYHTLNWNGRNQAGVAVASGIYVYRMVAGDFQQARKMLLTR